LTRIEGAALFAETLSLPNDGPLGSLRALQLMIKGLT
jgi:hypothetical protein